MASYHLSVKSGKKGCAKPHAYYIIRSGHHGEKEDLVAHGHGNLPEWSEGSPAKFWTMADKHERSNGAVYREVEVALPNELSMEQNVELARCYARELAGVKVYQFAVHSPTAAFGGCPQPHAHIMLSERMPDGIVRSSTQYFRRYNPMYPELGGCKKDNCGFSRAELAARTKSLRKSWEETLNAALEHYGHDVRVSHLSRTERGLSPVAERHLGPARIRSMDAEAKAAVTAQRAAL